MINRLYFQLDETWGSGHFCSPAKLHLVGQGFTLFQGVSTALVFAQECSEQLGEIIDLL